MLTSAFFSDNYGVEVHVYALPEINWRNLIIPYVLEHCLAQLLELWFLKRFVKYIKLARHFNCFVSEFLWGNCIYLVRFIKLESKLYMHACTF